MDEVEERDLSRFPEDHCAAECSVLCTRTLHCGATAHVVFPKKYWICIHVSKSFKHWGRGSECPVLWTCTLANSFRERVSVITHESTCVWPSRQNSKVGDSFILILVTLGVSNFGIAIKPSFISVSLCLLPVRTSWGASRLHVLTMVPAFPLSCLCTCELLTNVIPLDPLARVVRHRAGSSETGSPRRITIGNFKPVKKSVHILEQSLRTLLPRVRTRA